jgi:hypothetical protein
MYPLISSDIHQTFSAVRVVAKELSRLDAA